MARGAQAVSDFFLFLTSFDLHASGQHSKHLSSTLVVGKDTLPRRNKRNKKINTPLESGVSWTTTGLGFSDLNIISMAPDRFVSTDVSGISTMAQDYARDTASRASRNRNED